METRIEFLLLAANDFLTSTNLLVLLGLIGVFVFGLILLVFFSFINRWLQAYVKRRHNRNRATPSSAEET